MKHNLTNAAKWQTIERLTDIGETHDAYQAFLYYAGLQFRDRRLENVAEKTEYSLSQIKIWSADFNWDERASLNDTHQFIELEAKKMKKMDADIERWADNLRNTKERGFTIGNKMLDAAETILNKIPMMGEEEHSGYVEDKDGKLVPTVTVVKMNYKPSDVPRLVDSAVKTINLIHGLPTEIISSSVPTLSDAELSKMTYDEKVAALEALNRKEREIKAAQNIDGVQ